MDILTSNIIVLGIGLSAVFSIAHLVVTVKCEGELRADQLFKLSILFIVGLIPYIVVVAHTCSIMWFLADWLREKLRNLEGKVLWKRRKG